jgi:flagellin
MALTVATNTGALMAQAAASSVNKEMEISMERLSTGKRINGASDDAAGVAIASRLTSEIRGTNQAIRNALDAQALIDTAEGAQLEVVNLLQRMRELAVQAATDTNDANDRSNIAAEITALTAEIDRIANTTSWAGQELLDGATPDATVTTDNDAATFTFQIGSGTSSADELAVSIDAIGSTALGIAGSGNAPDALTNTTSASALSANTGSMSATQSTGKLVFASVTDNDVFTAKINGTEVTITVSFAGDNYEDTATGVAAQMKDAITSANISGLSMVQSAGTLTLNIGGGVSVTNSSNAQAAITTLDSAIATINTQRAALGSVSNRLDSTVSNLTNVSSNLQAGRGRIEDADFAAETTNLAKTQILQQASTAMLAQANAAKQNVLSLLQG